MSEFERYWNMQGSLVEEGNVKAESGHSHVVRASVTINGTERLVYIKKQTNYATAFSRMLHRTSSLCLREYANIMAWHGLGLPTMDAVYHGEIRNPLRGILVTLSLDGYVPLDDALKQASVAERSRLLTETAKLIRRIHEAGWVHRCFFPKHVFVTAQQVDEPLKMIDLEKARKAWLGIRDYARDLGSFVRRIEWASDAERDAFFQAYFGDTTHPAYRGLFMFLIGKRVAQKAARRQKNVDRCSQGN